MREQMDRRRIRVGTAEELDREQLNAPSVPNSVFQKSGNVFRDLADVESLEVE